MRNSRQSSAASWISTSASWPVSMTTPTSASRRATSMPAFASRSGRPTASGRRLSSDPAVTLKRRTVRSMPTKRMGISTAPRTFSMSSFILTRAVLRRRSSSLSVLSSSFADCSSSFAVSSSSFALRSSSSLDCASSAAAEASSAICSRSSMAAASASRRPSISVRLAADAGARSAATGLPVNTIQQRAWPGGGAP